MHPITRLLGVGVIFAVATAGWAVLGETMSQRTKHQSGKLRGDVSSLWGSPLAQKAPKLTFIAGDSQSARRPSSSDLDVKLTLDQRRRGLIWYNLYDVVFEGRWTYTHQGELGGELKIVFEFPDRNALYDGFRFVVNGKDTANRVQPDAEEIARHVPVEPGQTVQLTVAYRSRGLGTWRYVPSPTVANLERFRLRMVTDFADIDFPRGSLSPSRKKRQGRGWALVWDFSQVITGHHMGMVMPKHIQPGELATSLSFSAPISLGFFFLIIVMLATMRKIDIHPVNYLFLAAGFFAFHLLFSYSVDHITVVPAFVVSSLVSILLVVTYLRLVVSNRFAFVEAALAQLVYLIGFSVAHFWEGYTGISVTVLVIVTLFIVMQATGRIKWAEVLKAPPKPPPPPYHDPWAHYYQQQARAAQTAPQPPTTPHPDGAPSPSEGTP
jgi:hypothetical protein